MYRGVHKAYLSVYAAFQESAVNDKGKHPWPARMGCHLADSRLYIILRQMALTRRENREAYRMDRNERASGRLAAAITKSASRQTWYTIRFFVDRGRVADAYRAYAYFRWVDDVINAESVSDPERSGFVARQQSLLERGYRGETPADATVEEQMLVALVRHDAKKTSGLQTYLRCMMEVMAFDAGRRGRVVSQAELSGYSRKLAVAVTKALYYFIGHEDPSPRQEARYLAVTAAHKHMLRDAQENVEAGYLNIPRKYLAARGISPLESFKH